MAIVRKLQGNLTDIQKGELYAREFPVDANAVTADGKEGIEFCALFALDGNGTSSFYEDGVGVTAIKADATDEEKFAVGIVVGTSAKNMYGGLDINKDYRFKPYGVDQENMTLPPVKGALVKEYDDAKGVNEPIYNTETKVLTGTVEVAVGALDTVVGTGTAFDTELAVGDLIVVGGKVREVKTITDATHVVVSEDFDGAIAAGATAKRLHDIGRPVYLANDGFWTKIKPVTVGAKRQKVGYIESGTHVRIKIEEPEVIK
jgi:hypothetical protein